MRPAPVAGEWLFLLLLRIYPRQFRERYSAELLDTFRRDRRRARFSGHVGALRFWRHVLADLARTAVSERRHQASGGHRSTTFDRSHTSTGWGQAFGQDLIAGVRGLVKQPGYAAIVILTLGLGIGATTAVFAVVHGVLLSPLPYDHADRLVRVYELEHDNPGARMVAYGNFADVREQASSLEVLAAWQGQGVTLTGEGSALRLDARMASTDFARVFRARPTLGRWFTDTEVTQNAPVVVLTHALWQSAFGADTAVVGRTVHLDGLPHEVIGVMGPTFRYPGETDIWLPLPPVRDAVGQRRWHRHSMVGRLADGATLDGLAVELQAVGSRLEAAYPDYNKNNYFEARPLLDDMVGARRQALLVLLGAVSVLLIIACVNAASLSLARTLARAHEVAVRTALGASRWRLARLVLAESLLVGLAGGAVAVGLAQFGVTRLLALTVDSLPRAAQVSAWTPEVLAFGLMTTLLASLAVTVPALIGRRGEAMPQTLRARGTDTHTVMRGRQLLVVAQLSAAFMLAAGAGLLLKSVHQLTSVESGVAPEGVLTFGIGLPAARYPSPQAVSTFVDQLVDRFEHVPSISSAAATLTAPVDPYGWYNSLTIRGRDVAPPDLPHVSYIATSANYFDTVGIPLLAGRTYDNEPRGSQVVVINETAARQFWPDQDPIGQKILGRASDETSWTTIIGVVGDVRQALDQPVAPTTYIPIAQEYVTDLIMVVRTTETNTLAVMPRLRDLLAQADRDIPVTGIMPLTERIGLTTTAPTFNAVLMSTFAGIALLLAAAGVFAMVSFSVAQRHREFGIRIAVGAGRPRIFLDILGTNLRLAAVAISIGAICLLLVGQTLEGLLFGVRPADAASLTVAALVIMGVSLAAGLWPARRAAGADPLVALRND